MNATRNAIRQHTKRRLLSTRIPRRSITSSASRSIGYFQPFSTSSNVPQTRQDELQSSDGVIARPIDFDIASRIEGEESQIVTIDIEEGQILRAESGSMIYMTDGVQMETTLGSMGSAFSKMMTGQNLFYSDFSYQGSSSGQICLGTDFPSKIIRLSDLEQNYGGKLIAQKGALLCYSHTIDIQMEFVKKMTTGFFGGEGFCLMSLTGRGDVFLKAGGALVKKVLGEGEKLRVSSGTIVAFTQDIDFDVSMMPGIKNVLFGGEGLFVTTLTGPGTVWLQGQPADRMIAEIVSRIPSSPGIGLGVPLGVGGGGGESAEDVAGADDATEGVAATDAAIQADRDATIASSGFTSPDSESPSALFGDAISKEDAEFIQQQQQSEQKTTTDFDDSSSFSTSEPSVNDDEFMDDQTSFSTESSSPPDDGEDGSSILQQLWDFFTGDE